ncbi:unnamed protein product, partial [Laminaria digitata]
GTDGLELALSVIPAIAQIEDGARRETLYDLVAAGLSAAAQRELEAMALSGNHEFQSDVVKNILARGKSEGEKLGAHRAQAEMFLEALQHRGFAVDDAVRARVDGATSETLKQWMFRLLDGADLDQIFRDG